MALPLPHVKAFSGEAPSRMDALAVNKPEAGLDSGRQGSRGTAVVKVRDLACSVLRHRPPFGSSRRSGFFLGGLRGLGSLSALQAYASPPDLYPCRLEVTGSPGHSSPL